MQCKDTESVIQTEKIMQIKAGIAILTSDKVDFKKKDITRNK